jgi:carbon monoxide dehydrogenase subunit G
VIRVDRDIEVGRPAAEVFERLTKVEDLPRWQPAIVEAALTSEGPIGVGSTLRLVVAAGGQRTEATGTVVEFDRPNLIAIDASAGPANIRARVAVTEIDPASSRVAVGTEIALGGMLRFVEGMVRSRIEAEAPAAAQAVKDWLEAPG